MKKLKQTNKGRPLSGVVTFQHNNLVEANYSLSLQEKRIILWLISEIQKSDKDFKEHTLNVKTLMDIIGLEGMSSYTEIKKITFNLIQKGLKIIDLEKGIETQLTWLSCARYEDGNVSLSFHPTLRPFLLNLKSHFTLIKLSDVMQLSSIYAIRIYELLKQYEPLGERIIAIDELRKYCGTTSKLKQYGQFKERVILIAQREINAKSDIKFEFECIKNGRKVESIRFLITKNNQKQLALESRMPHRNKAFYLLEEFGLSKRIINKIISLETEQNISYAINAVEAQMKRGNVKNPKAMLLTAIKEKWNVSTFKKKNS